MDRSRVPPARVPGNNWRELAVAAPDRFEPELPVSVVVTYYEAPEALELTLAALEGQTYPRELFEVVIVDDGSRTPLAAPADSPLEVRVVHQEDRGFGLARARNTGARASDAEILVFLDCDMMPEAGWLAEHARWHHAACDTLTLGFRAHVDVDGIDADSVRRRAGSLADLFADRPSDRPAWIEYHMTRTRALTSDDDDLFRMVTGGNLGVSRSFFEDAGAYDESFTQWGGEDTEFGYRAFVRGGLLVPVPDALCWHQGAGASPSDTESASLELQQAKLSQLVATEGFRSSVPGRSFTVPRFVVTIEPGDPDAQLSTAEQVLAGKVHDLVVWIAEPDGTTDDPGRERLRRLLAGDPRMRSGPAQQAVEAIPAAPFRVSIPAGATFDSTLIERLRRELGHAVRAARTLPSGETAQIVWTRHLHRAARLGMSLEDYTQLFSQDRPAGSTRSLGKLGRIIAGAGRDARRVRGPADALNLVRSLWTSLAGAARWRIRRLTGRIRWSVRRLGRTARKRRLATKRLVYRTAKKAMKPRRPPDYHDSELSPAQYRLGPEMAAVGPLAEIVLGGSDRITSEIGPHTEALIVDTPEHAHRAGPGTPTVVVALSESDPRASVAAFDAESLNPLQWPVDHSGHGVALGPPELVTRAKRPPHAVDAGQRTVCRRAHHVVDTAAYHHDTLTRAGTLAALAATGAVVHIADNRADLYDRLGSELYGLMIDDRVISADQHQREAFSVAMRRSALRDHSLRARVRQLLAPTGLCGPPLPAVSILLATRRPDRVAAAIDAVAGQTYSRLELVLALHGEGFDRAGIDVQLRDLDHPWRVVEAPGHLPLGAVLNAAADESSGSLLTKFDDDDLYGPEHLWDLVLAHEYSRADLVGKGAEFVYLEGSGVTLHRFRGGGERYITTQSIAGGALMITRHCFDAVLGWRPIPRSVDQALITDVVAAGHRVYRTHGMGYVLVRHGEGHTWQAGDDYFLDQAHETRPGLDFGFAGIAPPGSPDR